MAENFLRALRSGISTGRLTGAFGPGDIPQPGHAPALAEAGSLARLPLVRRVGRRGLRLLRPLALPFLNRLEIRIRAAVDQAITGALRTETAGLKAALASRNDALQAELARQIDALQAELVGQIDALQAELADQTGALRDELTGRTDILRTELAERTDIARQEAASQAERLLGALQRGVIPLGEEFALRTPDGYLLVPAEDARLVLAMAEGGVLEPGTRRVLVALLRPGAVFVDVGAHVGTMTLLGARCVGPAGRVVAVEPTPRIAALLRRSLELNELQDRVTVEACAASDVVGEGVLHIGSTAGHNSLLPLAGKPADDARQMMVPLRRLDDILPLGTAADVVKIDAEGSELAVWRGMRRILQESPRLAAVIEFGPSHLARAGIAVADWLAELRAPGFEVYAIDEVDGTCRPARTEELAGLFSVNLLLLRGGRKQFPGLRFA